MLLEWRDVGVNGGPSVGTSLTDGESEKLAELASGRSVLEVGSYHGYSAILATLAGARHVVAVDVHAVADTLRPGSSAVVYDEFPPFSVTMRRNLRVYGVRDRVTIVAGRSQIVLPALAELGTRVDLVFVDGDHGHDAALEDFRNGSRLLNEDGILVAHDCDADVCPQVLEAWGEFLSDRGGKVEQVDTMGIWFS